MQFTRKGTTFFFALLSNKYNLLFVLLFLSIASEKHIVVYRLSAMGDVAMLSQTVHNILANNPEVRITLVTRSLFQSFFGEHERLSFLTPDLKGKHKGFPGLLKLATELKALKPTLFLDMHDVLRSKIVRSRLRLAGVPVIVFEKGRREKTAMLQGRAPFEQLNHSIARYNKAATQGGLTLDPNYQFVLPTTTSPIATKEKIRIGFAPFSAHESKEWGNKNTAALLETLDRNGNYEVLLFGGGKREVDALEALQANYENVMSVAGQYSLSEELAIIQTCDLFIAMDSSNMHMADLVGIKVLSIWIATHPYFGFYAWNNASNSVVLDASQHKSIPLSIFGKLKDTSDEHAAQEIRQKITPEMVLTRIKSLVD
jgi:ADP-heptose:LPS heptosyltransferase